jgi:hypothetical protein
MKPTARWVISVLCFLAVMATANFVSDSWISFPLMLLLAVGGVLSLLYMVHQNRKQR